MAQTRTAKPGGARATRKTKIIPSAQDGPIELAAIEYAGIAGASKECQDAVLRLIQWGDRITHAKILSCDRDHCLLLTVNVGDLVAVKSGFASGYGGTGPHCFSYTLCILDDHGAEIEEVEVTEELIERLDHSALTRADLEHIQTSRPHRPRRLSEYIDDRDHERAYDGTLWNFEFPPVIPFAVVDSRIMDLALSFWDRPDDKLMIAYRRLEDIIRTRAGLALHGTKLFAKVFSPNDGTLTWKDSDEGERSGRLNLFTGTYATHRNPRAHRELKTDSDELLSEFLLINHLFRLERSAIDAPEGSKLEERQPKKKSAQSGALTAAAEKVNRKGSENP